MAKFGIKVRLSADDNIETWMTTMSEYVGDGNIRPVEYNSYVEAETAAIDMGIKVYSIKEIPS